MRARVFVVILGLAVIALIAAGCPASDSDSADQSSDNDEATVPTQVACDEWTHPFGNPGASLSCGDSVDTTPDLLASRTFPADLGTLVNVAPAKDKIILLFTGTAPSNATSSIDPIATYASSHEPTDSLIKVVQVDERDSDIGDLWEQRFPGDRGHALPVFSNDIVAFGSASSGTCTFSGFDIADGNSIWTQDITDCEGINTLQVAADALVLDVTPVGGGTRTTVLDLETGVPGFTWDDVTPALELTYALGSEKKTLLRGSRSSLGAFNIDDGTEIWKVDLPLGPSQGGGFITDSSSIFISGLTPTGDALTVLSLDADTGETNWNTELPAEGNDSWLIKFPSIFGGPPAGDIDPRDNLLVQGLMLEAQSLGTWSLDPANGEQRFLLEYDVSGFSPAMIIGDLSNLYSLNIHQPIGELGDEEFPPPVFQLEGAAYEADGPPSHLWMLEQELLGLEPHGVVAADKRILFFGSGTADDTLVDTILWVFGS